MESNYKNFVKSIGFETVDIDGAKVRLLSVQPLSGGRLYTKFEAGSRNDLIAVSKVVPLTSYKHINKHGKKAIMDTVKQAIRDEYPGLMQDLKTDRDATPSRKEEISALEKALAAQKAEPPTKRCQSSYQTAHQESRIQRQRRDVIYRYTFKGGKS